MKKIILLLAILSSVHFFAQAQTNATRGTASVTLQKVEQEPVQEVPTAVAVISDSLAGTSSLENMNLSLSREFKEMEFDSWSIYHYMMANESAQYEASLAESSGRRKLNRKYSKVSHSIDSKSESPRH